MNRVHLDAPMVYMRHGLNGIRVGRCKEEAGPRREKLRSEALHDPRLLEIFRRKEEASPCGTAPLGQRSVPGRTAERSYRMQMPAEGPIAIPGHIGATRMRHAEPQGIEFLPKDMGSASRRKPVRRPRGRLMLSP